MSQIVLKAEHIHKIFNTSEPLEVLKGVCLEVKAGESIAITGKSGEGKSTLLHILGTLEKPTQGQLFILNEAVSSHRTPFLRNRHIGFIFQAFNLLEEYTLLDNLLMPARIGRLLTPAITEKALELLHTVDLYERRDYPAKKLSGGEKQRAAIARALVNGPNIILADEPTGNLDQLNSQKVEALLLDSCKLFHTALIIATHDKELAALCDRTLLLKEGLLWNS